MRVLVTGSGGYLGGRVREALAKEARFSLRLGTRQPPAGASDEDIVSLGGFDAASAPLMGRACRDMDAVVHLAALNEIESEADPVRAVDVNVAGTLRLVEAAREAGVGRFVYMSTAHVYGPLVGTIDEDRPTRPRHPYAITHRAAEDFVFAAAARSAMRPIVFRLSNAVGAPRTAETPRWTLLVNDLCRQLATTGKMVLRSSGLQARDFIAMSDVTRAIAHVLDVDAAILGDGLFNLGGDRSVRVIDMAERIASRAESITGVRPPIVRPAPSPAEEHKALDFRTEKLAQTGFSRTGDLGAELDETIRVCLRAFGGRHAS